MTAVRDANTYCVKVGDAFCANIMDFANIPLKDKQEC